jgi:Domain of unknown function (DUF4266)
MQTTTPCPTRPFLLVRRVALTALGLTALLTLNACTPVAAWERGNLAKTEMLLTPAPLDSALADHIHFSKEASSGGNSASGGGCGCN